MGFGGNTRGGAQISGLGHGAWGIGRSEAEGWGLGIVEHYSIC